MIGGARKEITDETVSYSDYGSFEQMNVSTNAKGADQMNSGITVGMGISLGDRML